MATTNFVDQQTVIQADWLNDADAHIYNQDSDPHPQYAEDTDLTAAVAANAASDGASLIGYTQGGTGASTTTVQAKLRELISVKDFGAVGDDSTNDTVAIQNAFATLGVTTNTIYFPRGIYRITDAITLSSLSNFDIKGPGQIKQMTGDTHIFTLSGCSNFSIKDLYFYGLGTDYVAASDTSQGIGIYLDNCNSFSIENNIFRNFGYAGIQCNGDCQYFDITKNKIFGTHGITSSITSGDIYQFGLIFKSGTGLAHPNTNFNVSNNFIQNTAMGIRTEPLSKKFNLNDNVIDTIKGQHGFYINGTHFSITGNIVRSTPFVGIKLQSFQHTPLAVTEAIADALVSNNTINDCVSGITVEKTSDLAANSTRVIISGNSVFSGSNTSGTGIGCYDVGNLVVSNNVVLGCAYGIYTGITTTGNGCSGKVIGNRVSNTGWAGIYGHALELLSIENNDVLRPCLLALTGDNQKAAIGVTSSDSGINVNVKDNSVFTGTSTGVVNAFYASSVDLWLGANDWESKPISVSGSTLRKRTINGDFVGLSLWSSIGALASGATKKLDITVTGVVLADQVVSVSLASDLLGCTLSAYVKATNTITVVLTNNTGSSQTVSDGFVRYSVMKFIA